MSIRYRRGRVVAAKKKTESAVAVVEKKQAASLELKASELLAALSYVPDVVPSGCLYHGWRVGLVSERIAASSSPEIARDVFFAGLLHDLGAVRANRHITQYSNPREQVDDLCIRAHPQLSANLLNWLPGMEEASEYVRCHHEYWSGAGYPEGRSGDSIPLGSRIIRLVDAADLAGCFRSTSNLRSTVPSLAERTGRMWPHEVWVAFVRTLNDGSFYRSLADQSELATMMAAKTAEWNVPRELDSETGVDRLLHMFAALVDIKDPSTMGHSVRTARYSEVLAQIMKLPEEDCRTAFRAGLVHDCGRIGVETNILNKSGRLSDWEMDAVRKHSEMTMRTMACLPGATDLAALGNVAGHDHERYDGQGYPDKLSGEEIPLISRIISVADAFDSMVSSKEYRLLTPKGAVVRIEQNAGSQFDPKVAEAMVQAVSDGALNELLKAA